MDRKFTSKKLSVGCPVLDHFLNGGLLLHGINEIAGESGSGKSQMGMQLALTAQTPVSAGGLDGKAVYVCTESSFPTRRLNQLIDVRRRQSTLNALSSDHILIEHAEDVENLLNILQKRVPALIRNFNAVERARKLYKLGDILHSLNANLGLVVVTINQISGVVTSEGKGDVSAPSLGLPWSNMVTTRLLFSRTNEVAAHMSRDDLGYSYRLLKENYR